MRSECYNAYADYFVKYLKEYERHGSAVYAVTMQNEPFSSPSTYPGMTMTASEQLNFLISSLAPKLKENGLGTKVVIYDHNLDDAGVRFVQTVLNNSIARDLVAGVAFHAYQSTGNHQAPNHSVLSMVQSVYSKEVWITEAGSGTWLGIHNFVFITSFRD